jgi:hypothetical protein
VARSVGRGRVVEEQAQGDDCWLARLMSTINAECAIAGALWAASVGDVRQLQRYGAALSVAFACGVVERLATGSIETPFVPATEHSLASLFGGWSVKPYCRWRRSIDEHRSARLRFSSRQISRVAHACSPDGCAYVALVWRLASVLMAGRASAQKIQRRWQCIDMRVACSQIWLQSLCCPAD